MPDLTVTIPESEIAGLIAYITDGSDLYDEHAVKVHGDGTRPGGLSPLDWLLLPALREFFTGDDRVMVDELLAEPPADDAFGVAMNRFMDKVVKGRDSGWTVKFEGDGEWEIALWMSGEYAGTWRINERAHLLVERGEIEVEA